MSVSRTHQQIASLQNLDDILRVAAERQCRKDLDVLAAYAAPSTEAEARLTAIWKDVLNIDDVGIDDNFFELSGDSLLMTQVISRIAQQFGLEMPIEAFFEGPSVRRLAETLASAERDPEGASNMDAALAAVDEALGLAEDGDSPRPAPADADERVDAH